MKKLALCTTFAMFVGAAGVAGGSKVQDAASLALSVPAALAIGGSELVVDTAASTVNGVAYGLRCVWLAPRIGWRHC